MSLKAILESLEDVPEQFHELYTERNGKYELTGIEGVKSQADIDRLQTALTKERNDHKAVKERYSVLGDRKPEEIVELLDRLPELEAAASGKVDDDKIQEIVEGRLKTKLAPLEREKGSLEKRVQELSTAVQTYEEANRVRTIHDELRRAGQKTKVLPEALEDALMLGERVFEVDEAGKVVARDGVGCTPGIEPEVWFSEIQSKRPHWWGPSQGGGAGGNRGNVGGANNPWSADSWNMTEQGRVLRENPTRAEQLAKSAGTRIGGPRPQPRK